MTIKITLDEEVRTEILDMAEDRLRELKEFQKLSINKLCSIKTGKSIRESYDIASAIQRTEKVIKQLRVFEDDNKNGT